MELNTANSRTECPSCRHSIGVDADLNFEGTRVVYRPARGESIECKTCNTIICAAL